MPNKITIREHLETAERLAADNGGKLPVTSKLVSMGHATLVHAIQKDRTPFEHLLAKDAHRRDKVKFAFVESHRDLDDAELAQHVGLSVPTIQRWKHAIAVERGETTEERSPEPAPLEELCEFVTDNIPEGWRLVIEMSVYGCYATLVGPRGNMPNVRDAEGKDITAQVVVNLNYARKRAGMGPVELKGSE